MDRAKPWCEVCGDIVGAQEANERRKLDVEVARLREFIMEYRRHDAGCYALPDCPCKCGIVRDLAALVNDGLLPPEALEYIQPS